MKKKLLWGIACIMMMFMFSGCTAYQTIAVDTTVTASTRFSGEREIKTILPSAVLKAYFGDDIEQLEDMLNSQSPEEMYCDATATEAGVEVAMYITFTSYEEYYEKVKAIFAAENAAGVSSIVPEIYFEYSSNMFKKGYILTENFTSVDLLAWLPEAMRNSENKSWGSLTTDLDAMFTNNTTTVVFNKEATETTAQINVNKMSESNAFSKIAVETTILADNTLMGKVSYYISQSAVSNLGTTLDDLMETLVLSGATLESMNETTQRIYQLSFTSATVEGYLNYMNRALRNTTSVLELVDENDAEDTFLANRSVKQYYDGSYFLDFSKEGTSMSYSVRVSPDYGFDSIESKYNFISNAEYNSSSDYFTSTVTLSAPDEVTLHLGYSLAIEAVNVTTTVNSDRHIVRQFQFVLDSATDKIVGKSFGEKITTLIGENEGITFEKGEDIQKPAYNVIIEGNSAQDIAAKTAIVLNNMPQNPEENAAPDGLHGGMADEKRLREVIYEYTDVMNFTNFLNGAKVTNGISYYFIYPSNFEAGFEIGGNYAETAENGNQLMCRTMNQAISVSTKAVAANKEGIRILIIFFVSLIGSTVLIFINFKRIKRILKTKTLKDTDQQLFTKKGYIMMTATILCIVFFVYAALRLILKIY